MDISISINTNKNSQGSYPYGFGRKFKNMSSQLILSSIYHWCLQMRWSWKKCQSIVRELHMEYIAVKKKKRHVKWNKNENTNMCPTPDLKANLRIQDFFRIWLIFYHIAFCNAWHSDYKISKDKEKGIEVGINMHIFGLAMFLFGNTGGIHEMSHINVLAYFQDDWLTWSIYSYVGMCVYICWMGSVRILW